MLPVTRWKRRCVVGAFGVLLLVQLALALRIPEGHYNIDEFTYHMMARDFGRSGSFLIENGYEEFPSPELSGRFIRVHQQRLAAQYPYYYTIIASPLYGYFGLRGLFIVNAVAFLAIVVMTYVLAQLLFRDYRLSVGAAAVLLLASFFPEYAPAAWPHALAVALGMGAFVSMAFARQRREEDSRWLSLASGLLIGVAAGVRLDAVFMLPIVLLPFLFASPVRWRSLLLVVAGVLPGLVGQSAINAHRFAVLSPLSYGTGRSGNLSVGTYLLAAVVIVVVVGAVRVLSEPRYAAWRRWRIIVGVVLFSVATVAAVSPLRELAVRALHGAWAILVDIRQLPEDQLQDWQKKAGLPVYWGGPKKALLQSCPYLVVLFALLWPRAGKSDRVPLLLLSLTPLVFCGVFAGRAWHGGAGLNMRYLLPTLPYLAILVAYCGRYIVGTFHGRWPLFVAAFLSLGVAAIYVVPIATGMAGELPARLTLHLTVPLVLALVLLLSVFLAWRFTRLRPFSGALLAGCLVWAGVVAYGVDFKSTWQRRADSARLATELTTRIPNHSLLFADNTCAFIVIKRLNDVLLAIPQKEGEPDVDRLTAYHLRDGRRVFGALHRRSWWKLRRAGAFKQVWWSRPLFSMKTHCGIGQTFDLREAHLRDE